MPPTPNRLFQKPPAEGTTWQGVFCSPVGYLQCQGIGDVLTGIDYAVLQAKHLPSLPRPARRIEKQLQQYFDQAKAFSLESIPLAPQGTNFQQRVWAAICDIPFGETLTYGELAKRLNTAAQPVGQALKHNPISLIIPCHRIVAQSGLGGYGGHTDGIKIKRKQWLLTHEQQSTRRTSELKVL